MTQSQLVLVHTLLSTNGIKDKDDKADIIRSFTAGRTSSSREMTHVEATALINHLKSLDPSERSADRMRKKIISMAHQMGWKTDGKLDIGRVNNWCIKFSYLKKKLDAYEYTELPRLVSQFENVYKDYLRKV
jgi:hypothetical protein